MASKRARIDAITVSMSSSVTGEGLRAFAPGCDFLTAPFDQASLATIFAVANPLGLAKALLASAGADDCTVHAAVAA